jgi:hypothetical protein
MKTQLHRHAYIKYKLKTINMKKLFVIIAVLVSITSAYGQKSIDALFEKYAGKDGFTTVTLNGSMLKFAGSANESEKDGMSPDISEIRILAVEDKSMKIDNFYDMVIKDIDLSLYEEFMRVKESNQNVRMLVRADGENFKEFLLIAGGDDNALIQIKGNLNLEDAKKFSEDAKNDPGKIF